MNKTIYKTIILMMLTIAMLLVTENSLTYAAEKKQGVDVLLVIDTSLSMGFENRDPHKEALEIADYFVKTLPDKDLDLRLGVYNFSEDVHEIFSFGKVNSEKSDKQNIQKEIIKLEYVGPTDMGDAFEKCADVWEKEMKDDSETRKQIIVFLTDGEISFLDDVSDEAKKLISDSRCRMNKALDRIDSNICPVYVIAFGDEAIEGEDAKSIASREGNRFLPAKEQKELSDAYNNVFENLLGTKKSKREHIEINIDNNKNTIDLNNDNNQRGLIVNITKNESGSGSVIDDEIEIKNDSTGKVWKNNAFEDYYNALLGRLVIIPEDISKSGPLSIVFKTTAADVIDMNEYFLYDISYTWTNKNGEIYDQGQDITFKLDVDGIDTNSFVAYAIFEKDDKKGQQVIPDKIYSGDVAEKVKIYGSSLDEKNWEIFTGVKMLLDTQDKSYQTTVAFDNPGDYKVHIYGENERGFAQSDELKFSVVKFSKTEEQKTTWKEKFMNAIQKLWKMYVGLNLVGKVLAPIIGIFIVILILRSIGSKNGGSKEDDDNDGY